ncbi:hypothetical protein TNCV_3934321 [Trichonephila clavipes]|nr:hypothetical protein TNCV_3934321 [Trichonephila clavipes]
MKYSVIELKKHRLQISYSSLTQQSIAGNTNIVSGVAYISATPTIAGGGRRILGEGKGYGLIILCKMHLTTANLSLPKGANILHYANEYGRFESEDTVKRNCITENMHVHPVLCIGVALDSTLIPAVRMGSTMTN